MTYGVKTLFSMYIDGASKKTQFRTKNSLLTFHEPKEPSDDSSKILEDPSRSRDKIDPRDTKVSDKPKKEAKERRKSKSAVECACYDTDYENDTKIKDKERKGKEKSDSEDKSKIGGLNITENVEANKSTGRNNNHPNFITRYYNSDQKGSNTRLSISKYSRNTDDFNKNSNTNDSDQRNLYVIDRRNDDEFNRYPNTNEYKNSNETNLNKPDNLLNKDVIDFNRCDIDEIECDKLNELDSERLEPNLCKKFDKTDDKINHNRHNFDDICVNRLNMDLEDRNRIRDADVHSNRDIDEVRSDIDVATLIYSIMAQLSRIIRLLEGRDAT